MKIRRLWISLTTTVAAGIRDEPAGGTRSFAAKLIGRQPRRVMSFSSGSEMRPSGLTTTSEVISVSFQKTIDSRSPCPMT